MTPDIEPMQSFLAAAKYDFLSKHMKTGGFTYFNFCNIVCGLSVNEENDTCSTSMSISQQISVTVDKPV